MSDAVGCNVGKPERLQTATARGEQNIHHLDFALPVDSLQMRLLGGAQEVLRLFCRCSAGGPNEEFAPVALLVL